LEANLDSALHAIGLVRPTLETVFPPLEKNPVYAFFAYLVALDLFGYWVHRMQHRFGWWWALHALHHSQRQMTFWSDNRNHVLDDFIVALATALFIRLIGVPPGQFIALAAFAVLIENLSHANTRLWFGRLGDRLLVSPRFHRWHHAIGDGHEGRYLGVNFSALFPVWDMLFGSADFRAGSPPTGIRDQLSGAAYGDGWWAQQFLGFKRLWRCLTP
jgi:sterol desaturase/sphingolipid hydroxylase (fatty acid hydroxylase superfamily)